MTIDLLNYWLMLPKVWIILGISLVTFELLIGTGYIALSFGVAAMLMAAVFFFQGVFEFGVINDWIEAGFLYGLLSFVAILILKLVAKEQSPEQDINKY